MFLFYKVISQLISVFNQPNYHAKSNSCVNFLNWFWGTFFFIENQCYSVVIKYIIENTFMFYRYISLQEYYVTVFIYSSNFIFLLQWRTPLILHISYQRNILYIVNYNFVIFIFFIFSLYQFLIFMHMCNY